MSMNFSIIILVLLVVAFSASTVWNSISLRSLTKRPHRSDSQLNDSKYFELKYKQEFLVAIVSFITAVAVFLGYNTMDNIRSELRKEIADSLRTKYVELSAISDSIKDLSTNLSEMQNSLSANSTIAFQNQLKQQELMRVLSSSQSQANAFKNRMDELNKKNILKQEIYLVAGLEFDVAKGYLNENPDSATNATRYYFKDLRTVLGEPLPAFKEAPVIVATTNAGATISISEVTTTSFLLWSGAFSFPDDEPRKSYKIKVNLLISEIPSDK